MLVDGEPQDLASTSSQGSSKQSGSSEGGGVDIKKLLAVVPPPPTLLAKEKKSTTREKRVRLVYDPAVAKDEAKISKALAEELNITQFLEISVAGKKRFKFKAVVVDSIPSDVVYVNPEPMKIHGIANNSICTIRSAS